MSSKPGKKEEKKDAPKKEETKKDAPKKEDAKKEKDAPKKEDTKKEKDAPKKEEVKKEETKKETPAPKKEGPPKEKKTEGGNLMDDISRKQVFKKFSYRGEDLNKLITLNMDDLAKLFRSRQRRRLRRKLHPRYGRFIKRLMDAKKKCPVGEKPKTIKTHLRDCIVIPSMIQSMVNIHNGRAFNTVEIKPEMIGYYLGEFAMTYKRVTHGKPGVGATHSSKFVPIK